MEKDIKQFLCPYMLENDAQLKQALREKAEQELKGWYDQRRVVIEKQKSRNRLNDADPHPEPRASVSQESGKYVNYIRQTYATP